MKFLLCLLLAFFITGCNSNKDEQKTDKSAQQELVKKDASAQQAEPAQEQNSADEEGDLKDSKDGCSGADCNSTDSKEEKK